MTPRAKAKAVDWKARALKAEAQVRKLVDGPDFGSPEHGRTPPRSYEAGWDDAIDAAVAMVREYETPDGLAIRSLKRPAPVEQPCPHVFSRGKRCAVCDAVLEPKATRRTVAKAFKAGASREQIAADVGEPIEWVEARIRSAFRKPKRTAKARKR